MRKAIFDLDGTLALIDHRRHLVKGDNKNWELFYEMCIEDKPNIPVIRMFQALRDQGWKLEIWSGRDAIVRPQTRAWLKAHDIQFNTLQMRPSGSFQKDDEMKEKWLTESRWWGNEDPQIVFDDRNKVVDMWRRNGIVCCQVAPGNF